MNRHIYNCYLIALVVVLLSSCVATQRQQGLPESELQPWQQVWQQDLARHNDAVRQLAQTSDQYIENQQYEKAATTLERVLRIDNRVASVWSRLAWLASEQQQYKRAQNLITRSNSLTADAELLQFNWRLYRDASDYRNDEAGVQLATQKLNALN